MTEAVSALGPIVAGLLGAFALLKGWAFVRSLINGGF